MQCATWWSIDSKSQPFWVSEWRRSSGGDRATGGATAGSRSGAEQYGVTGRWLTWKLRRVNPPPEQPQALGYASVSAEDRLEGSHFRSQAETIEGGLRGPGSRVAPSGAGHRAAGGSDLKRPGLMYALETIAAGEASCLVVSGLDRLARSASDLGTLVEWFEQNGGRLVAVDLDLDTDTEAGQTAARALVAAGELDRRRLAERTKKGLAAARAKGVRAAGRL